MKIIVVGCGNVGGALTEQLCKEGHNVTVIDDTKDSVEALANKCDIMGVVGDGASYSTQMEAGVEQADLLIAVTDSDEVNLLCCLIAKKAGDCSTIARVRNPVYNREVDFIKEELGLSMTINPELATAHAIARLLKFPSAISVETFAKGKVELSSFKLDAKNVLVGLQLKEVSSRLGCNVLICIVERDGEVHIPGGNFTLKENDVIHVAATPKNIVKFFRAMGMATKAVKDALIVGGGSTTYYLAQELLSSGIATKIIERDPERADELSELLPDAQIICGDGADRSVLKEEGIDRASAFVSMTNMDEENIMLSMFARKVSQAKVVTRIHRIYYDELIKTLDVGSIIFPKYTTAEEIVRYVRAMSNSLGSNVETLYQLVDNRAEALEFWIRETSPVVGVPLSELSLKDNLLLACINRNGSILIPGGQDKIMVGDTVIVITTHTGLHDVKDILEG